MRFSDLKIAAILGLAGAGWHLSAVAQTDRDFVFTDNEGYRLIRFAGTGSGGLNESQRDELINPELSTMVHDRLQADIRFEGESVDAKWAGRMVPRLEALMSQTGQTFSAIVVECRSASCRILLEHSMKLGISEHQALMESVQQLVQTFIAANPANFEPVFLITAYEQEQEIPNIRVFLQKAVAENQAGPPGESRH
jgi:outer membrane lipopolysaccharide assembly protein LptE/RlpB